MTGRVTLYTVAGCPFCAAKRRELADNALAYTEINISEHPERIPELLKLSGGRRIVPVVVAGGEISVAPEGGSHF